MRDHAIFDSVRAAWIFGIGALSLIGGAALGLNTWPAQSIVSALWNASADGLYVEFYGYSLIVGALFWGSRPSRAAQWTVLLTWPLVTILLWRAFDANLHISWFDAAGFPAPMLIASGMLIPAILLLGIRLFRSTATDADSVFEMRLRYVALLTLLFIMVSQPALSLTATLHPYTFDLYALHWDAAAGLNLTPWLTKQADSWPLLPELLDAAYGLTPLGFLAVAIRHLRAKPSHVASGVLTWVVLSTCGYVAYHLFPVAGPKYLFGSDGYVAVLSRGTTLPLELARAGTVPRNGMPSLHFGWMLAASILWWRTGSAWWSRALLIAMTALTAAATLYTGEHYLVDLIVAVPFVLAAIALSTTAVPWSAAPRRWAVLAGFGLWAAWVVVLRTSIYWLVDRPWACWAMVLVTAGVVVLQTRWMLAFAAHVAVAPVKRAEQSGVASDAVLGRRLGVMFFASGAATLVYQVLFAKQLALVFGSTATATITVLATFLGGMAIGSLLGGRLAPRVSRPLAAYALVEMLIAAYCVLTPALFDLIQQAYVALASGQPPDAPWLLGLRIALGASVLLVPTVLMGITLPLLSQVLGGHLQRIGDKVAWLYFSNTAGAAVGALMTSYAVIPMLGVSRTTLVAAVLNLLVALGALELSKRIASSQQASVAEGQRVAPHLSERAVAAALLALGVGGILSLGLEVVYVHMLSIVAGNSVYAFGLMLATFLLGLAGGGEAARRLLVNPESDRVRLLAWTILGLAASVAAGTWWWNDIPEYFASFAQHPAARSFAAREAIRGVVCALLMIPPTLFIGAAYAFGMDIATAAGPGPERAKPIVMLGRGAALNTLGNIVGVLLFGFVLLPFLGGLDAIRVIAFGAWSLAAIVLVVAAKNVTRRDVVLFSGTATVVAFSLFAHLNYDTLSSGANVYFFPQKWGTVTQHAESIDGGLTTVAVNSSPQGSVKTLLTNGKFQGNDAWQGEMKAQLGFALAPLLHQEHRERALVIGYGTGVTSRVFHEAGFRHLDIAELSRDVVRLADAEFATVNNHVSSAPGVQLHVTDGRNLLLLSPPQSLYDVISIEISSIWFAGAASLYNREFYALARSRLATDGVLQQWVQLHRLAPTDIFSIIASLRAEFHYVSLYVIGGQGILIATNSAAHKDPTSEAMLLLENARDLATVRNNLDGPIATIASERLLDSQAVDRYIEQIGIDGRVWWSTDDNLALEYSTPKANVNDGQKSYQNNVDLLSRFR